MTSAFIRLSMLCMAIAAPAAMAASRCPLIRPAGLSPQQVDGIVAGTYAAWLHQPVGQVDTRQTIARLDGTDNATLTYSFATADISSTLGFDAVELFYDAARAKAAKEPSDLMSIAELQALARQAYARGHDEAPPKADPSAEYAVGGLAVRAPSSPAGDWRLTHCGASDVTFVQRSEEGDFAASLRSASMSRYTSDAAFLAEVGKGLQGRMPPQFKLRPWQPALVKGTRAPCADAALQGDDPVRDVTLFLRVRVCYLRPDNPNTWFVLFSETLPAGRGVDTAAAEAFVGATSPK